MSAACQKDWDKIDGWIAEGKVLEEVLGSGPVGVCAYHGGEIEYGTEPIARCVAADTGAKTYILSGRLAENNYALLHEPSPSFPTHRLRFQEWLSGLSFAVSLHGHALGGRWGDDPLRSEVLIGGRNRDMAARFAALALPTLPQYTWTTDAERLRQLRLGGLLNNPVNLPSPHGGIQFELPRRLRDGAHSLDQPPQGDALRFAELLAGFIREVSQSL